MSSEQAKCLDSMATTGSADTAITGLLEASHPKIPLVA